MKIALAQIDTTVGDFKGNRRKIEDSLVRANSRGVDLVVFPEMAVTGYPAGGLLNQSKFISDNLKCLDQVVQKTSDTAAIIGYVRQVPRSAGKPLENVAALISSREIVSTHVKSALGVNSTFDEHHYFEPAGNVSAVDFGNLKLGICFFDDVLPGSVLLEDTRTFRDPVFELVERGAEVIVVIASCPFDFNSRGDRLSLLKQTARKHSRPLVFVNQVGGNDELILDGGSVVLDADGEVLARADDFKEDFVVVDIDSGVGDVRPRIEHHENALFEALVLGTRDYARKCGFSSSVLSLDADLESSIVATIAARALGPSNVFGVVMPSRLTVRSMVDDALNLASNLKMNFQIIDIDTLLSTYLDCLAPVLGSPIEGSIEMGTQASIRASVLTSLSNTFGHLVLTTFNRSQFWTGQTTLTGNVIEGLAVISDVSSTLVERIANLINMDEEVIPASIVKRTEKTKFSPGDVDGALVPPYTVVDPILERLIDQDLTPKATISEGFEEEAVMEVVRLMKMSEQKRRQAPPGLKILTQTSASNGRIPLGHHFTP